MGLDMFLKRKTYVKNWDFMTSENHEVTVKLNGNDHPYIDLKKVTYVEEEVGYWRKVNAIHRWFVDNCQDGRDECQESYISIEQIKELYDICKQIQADHNLAELLPPQEVFFFGDIDEWYFHGIDDTIEQLEPLIKLNEELEAKKKSGELVYDWPEYFYRASW